MLNILVRSCCKKKKQSKKKKIIYFELSRKRKTHFELSLCLLWIHKNTRFAIVVSYLSYLVGMYVNSHVDSYFTLNDVSMSLNCR